VTDSRKSVRRLNQILILTSIVATAVNAVSAADQRIAFERDDAVYIADNEGSNIRKVAEGIFPAVSSDGKSIAFTVVTKTDNGYIRRIATADIASGSVRIFKDIPGDNAYYATWSPDGTSIAFTLSAEGVWNLALINADGSGFRVIKKGEQNKATLFSPCWAADGKSLFCQDMTNIYQIGLGGSVIKQWQIGKIVPNGTMSGDGRIDVAPDGGRLLLSVDMDEEYDRKDWDGPVPALWSFDLLTEASVRLTSKAVFAWDGSWLDNSKVLFVSQPIGKKQTLIYRTDGKGLKKLVDDARRPSVSRP